MHVAKKVQNCEKKVQNYAKKYKKKPKKRQKMPKKRQKKKNRDGDTSAAPRFFKKRSFFYGEWIESP